MRKYRVIKDTPRSKIRSMAMGIVEIHGSAEVYNNDMIKTPFSQTDCLYYKYKIEEYRKSGGGKGKSTYRWETVSSGEQGTPFLAKDDNGVIQEEDTQGNWNTTGLGGPNLGRHKLFLGLRFGWEILVVTAEVGWGLKSSWDTDLDANAYDYAFAGDPNGYDNAIQENSRASVPHQVQYSIGIGVDF